MSTSEAMEVSSPQTKTNEEAIPTIVASASDDEPEVNKVEISDDLEAKVESDQNAEDIRETLIDSEQKDTENHEGPTNLNLDALPVATTLVEAEINGNGMDTSETSKITESEGNNRDTEIPEISQCTEETKQRLFYNWNAAPKLLCSATEEYSCSEGNENFTKGCHWSPDGTCLMVPADDFRIRIYELPREFWSGKIPQELPTQDLKPALAVREGGLVYDCCWYPLMNSWAPETCCFLSTSRESPLHLWDAFTGELRATYRPYNQVDEVEAAISAQFINGGGEVWCGFKGALRSFDTERPGRQKNTISLKKDFPNVTGLVSCIRENPVMPGLVAFGTYSKCIGLYKDGPLCSLKTDSGVTQLEFSPCGTKLYTAVRRNNEFLCWDLRNPGVVLYSLEGRSANTNQRIQFALSSDGSEIVSGGTDGFAKIWRVEETESYDEDLSSLTRIQLSTDCLNGVNIHKNLPILATSSGQRICEEDETKRDSSVRLWYFANEH